MEPQMGVPNGSDFGLYSGAGSVFAVVGDQDACPGAYAGAHDDGVEQPAHGVFGAVVAGAGVEAAGGAAVLASVDAAKCCAGAAPERAIDACARALLFTLSSVHGEQKGSLQRKENFGVPGRRHAGGKRYRWAIIFKENRA